MNIVEKSELDVFYDEWIKTIAGFFQVPIAMISPGYPFAEFKKDKDEKR
jgi:hypothetical protein